MGLGRASLYAEFGDKLPGELQFELDALVERLRT